jgi:hypothetical protein
VQRGTGSADSSAASLPVGWDAAGALDVLSSLPLAGHQQLADAFQVKTAERHRGILVTFDRGATPHDPSGRQVLVLDAQI